MQFFKSCGFRDNQTQADKSARIVTACLTFLQVLTLTAIIVNITVFFVVAPFSLVEVYKLINEHAALQMGAAASSETLVTFYQITLRQTSEDNNLPVKSTSKHVMRV
jgi:hypothetical protein